MIFSKRFNFSAASCVLISEINTQPTNCFGLVRPHCASLVPAESPSYISWHCVKLVQKCHTPPPKTKNRSHDVTHSQLYTKKDGIEDAILFSNHL